MFQAHTCHLRIIVSVLHTNKKGIVSKLWNKIVCVEQNIVDKAAKITSQNESNKVYVGST